MLILAIDPGNEQSAYVLMGEDYKPLKFGKIANKEMLHTMGILYPEYKYDKTVIEMVASYGMAVGKTVFDTCVWIGRFVERSGWISDAAFMGVELMYRKDVKMNLCGQTRAKDSNIRQALIDRFAKTKTGKGTKKEPDFFYGFKADIWQAYAVGVTYLDKEAGNE